MYQENVEMEDSDEGYLDLNDEDYKEDCEEIMWLGDYHISIAFSSIICSEVKIR